MSARSFDFTHFINFSSIVSRLQQQYTGLLVSFYGSIDYPWIELEWDTPRSIDRIHLYDRPSQQIHTAGITIHFDDGSRLPVNTIPNDGTAKVVEFAPKTTNRLRFEVTDGDGPTLGLSEIEVFPSPQDYPDYVSYVDP